MIRKPNGHSKKLVLFVGRNFDTTSIDQIRKMCEKKCYFL